MSQLQILKDIFKRKFMDAARRGNRLKTPMDVLIGQLSVHGYLPGRLDALELFGMHGLWHTRDYFPFCGALEFYEIDPLYAAYARKTLAGSRVHVKDSILTVREGRLDQRKYNFIVIDNPATPFGNGYIEHFDLFPHVLNYIDEGVLTLNFLHDPPVLSEEHSKRRQEFYGIALPGLKEALNIYRNHFNGAGLTVEESFYVPRNRHLGYLSFVVRKKIS
jgi:hypothetical protein